MVNSDHVRTRTVGRRRKFSSQVDIPRMQSVQQSSILVCFTSLHLSVKRMRGHIAANYQFLHQFNGGCRAHRAYPLMATSCLRGLEYLGKLT